METVTPEGVLTPPIVSITGAAGLVLNPAGIFKLTCATPVTRPGAAPAYNTCAGVPAIEAVTGNTVDAAVSLIWPSVVEGLTVPNPVP